MSWANFLQLLVSGLAMGAIYTLTAKGLFIAHLATNRLNFAQGDFLMIAALLTLALRGAGLPVVVVIPLVVALLGLGGWLLERGFIRPLDRLGFRGGGEYSWILTTAGAGLIGGLAVGTIIGAAATAPRYYPPPPVYVAPAPYCYWTRGEPVWDGYRGVWTYPSVRVCE